MTLSAGTLGRTSIVSFDLDIVVPVHRQPAVKARLGDLLEFRASHDEPSVWTPHSSGLLGILIEIATRSEALQ
jgi:hypothetical protein